MDKLSGTSHCGSPACSLWFNLLLLSFFFFCIMQNCSSSSSRWSFWVVFMSWWNCWRKFVDRASFLPGLLTWFCTPLPAGVKSLSAAPAAVRMGSLVWTPGTLPAWKATIFLFNIISAAVAKRHVVYWNSTNTRWGNINDAPCQDKMRLFLCALFSLRAK